MPRFPKFVLLCLLVISCVFCLSGKSDGISGHKPEELKQGLSKGALELVQAAFRDIDSNRLIDTHVHLISTGSGNSGNFVNPRMLSPWHVSEHLKFSIYLKASGIAHIKNADPEFITRLKELIADIPGHGKYCLLGFDQNYFENGTPNPAKTEFYVSNEYVFHIAEQYPDLFVPVMSVHPYRKDALNELTKWAAKGGRLVKWLPNAMGIDPSSPRCDSFYMKMKELHLVLLSHAGEEKAVNSEKDQELGNPLLLRRPLDRGVKVIIAHCASLGEGYDMDDRDKKKVSNFSLFLRMMQEKKYEGLLWADISALTQNNRSGKPLLSILKNSELQHRLINGSDYPLPAVNIIIRTRKLLQEGLITDKERHYLHEIYRYNPLLFDFVLKRTLKDPGTKKGFPADVFMRRDEVWK